MFTESLELKDNFTLYMISVRLQTSHFCPLLSVGLGVATLCVGLLVRVLVTFCVVLFAGFNMKEKIFISLAWMPKATVQVSLDKNFIEIMFSLLYLQRTQ